jgi:ribosomal protein S20
LANEISKIKTQKENIWNKKFNRILVSKLRRRIKQFNVCLLTYKLKVSEKWIASW